MLQRRVSLVALVALTLLIAPARAVVLDPVFGAGGKAFDASTGGGVGVVVEPGPGRIFALSGGAGRPEYVERYLAGGTLDAPFGTGGRVRVDDAIDDNDITVALARQPLDGKLLVLGYEDPPGPAQVFIRRYDADGNLDPSFGTAGTAIVPTLEFAPAIVALPDGRMVVAGHAVTGDYPGAIVRLLADGTPDPGFGSGGVVVTGTAPGAGNLTPSALLLVAGDALVAGGTDDGAHLVLARYQADGTLDATFGSGGFAATRPAGVAGDIGVDALVLQADGKIVAVGTGRAFGLGPFPWVVARHLADGTLDASYGAGGAVVLEHRELRNHARAVLDGDGVVVAASTMTARLTADGVLDPSFAPCVFAFEASVISSTFSLSSGVGLARQDDGKLVLAGRGGSFGATFSMLRYVPGSATCMPAEAGRSKVISRFVNGQTNPRLTWKWKSSAAVALGDFGDPFTRGAGDSYGVCLVDAGAPPGLRGAIFMFPFGCEVVTRQEPCWEPIGQGAGYRLRDRRSSNRSLDVTLRPGGAGAALIVVKGREAATADVGFPPYAPPLAVRFTRNASPFCWEATFSSPSRDDALRFTAKSD